MHKIARTYLAFSAFFVAGIPCAALATDVPMYYRTVNVADLDLASPKGEATLNRRIALAALAVCNMAGINGAGGFSGISDCRIAAMREAKHSAEQFVAAARQSTKTSSTANHTAARG